MSSMYRLICLSHDPGLTLHTEWHSGGNGRDIAAGALLSREGSPEIETHAQCDMVIGRYSYSLTEVGYVAALAALPDPPAEWPAGWTANRVHRLRRHL